MNKNNVFEEVSNTGGLENIQEFLKGQRIENKWHNTGEAIRSGAKIYGLQVDNIHSQAYHMMSRIHIPDDEDNTEEV